MDLSDEVAIVTGGGRGIGKEISVELARKGASVVVVARTQEEIDSVCEQITDTGGEASGVSIDVSLESDVKKLIEFTEDKFGPPGILVNNAGIRGPVGFILNVEY